MTYSPSVGPGATPVARMACPPTRRPGGTVSVAAGETTKTIQFTVVNDTLVEVHRSDEFLEAHPDDLQIRDGRVSVKGMPARAMSVGEVASRRNFRKGALLYDFVMAPALELKGKVTFGAIFTMLGVKPAIVP